ncbi:parathyroid hormone/parathyroid hormone-related peptide receptor-like isoform X1 [Atheta coriaria]|uniref:parathyroid hormone/parathyroid hormone-related peptide receptor-like isoform X1 n=1 Tax=Dalotia coriaria TaxID=877792 RepID=UPI0031F432DA
MDVREQACREHPLNGSFSAHEKFCQLIFDGFLCWMATRAGELAHQPCPSARASDSIVNTFQATKQCDLDGNWYVSPEQGKVWTNYSECDLRSYSNGTAVLNINVRLNKSFIHLLHEWLPTLKCITHYGYWISLITLLFCVFILISIKKLHCARNVLHIHFFMSFILRATAYLLKTALIVDGLAFRSDLATNSNGVPNYITEHFNWVCKFVMSTWYYFTQANFMFMLMEGIYLHNLMFLNLFSEKSSVRIYYLFGWGIPLCFIPTWAVLRTLYDDDMCWTTSNNDYILWLTKVPRDLSVLINFSLFVSIMRILCIKIKSMYVQHNKVKYRRLLRSTLTLMLIYAVPYTLSVLCLGVVSYYRETMVELIWICYDQIFSAFQGLLMGLIYCLLNSEVRSEVRQQFYSFRYSFQTAKRTRATRTISHTMQFTIPIPIKEDPEHRRTTDCNCYKSTENL